MKTTTTLKRIVLLGAMGMALPAFAQITDEGNTERTTKVTITVTENGETTTVTREIPEGEEVDIDALMEEYGIDNDMNEMMESEDIDIIIRKGMEGKSINCEEMCKGMSMHKMFIDHSDKPMLGVHLENGEAGALVTKVIPESGAEKAGLQQGDVIVKINGEPTPNYETLIDALEGAELGDQVNVEYLRDGQTMSTTAEMGERTFDTNSFRFEMEGGSFEGMEDMEFDLEEMEMNLEQLEIEMERLGETMGENAFIFEDGEWKNLDGEAIEGNPMAMMYTEDGAFLGVSPSGGCGEEPAKNGVRIGKVTPGSTAEEMGLQCQDIITKINGEAVNDFDALAEQIGSAEPGDEVKISFVRDGKKMKAEGALKNRSEVVQENTFFNYSSPHSMDTKTITIHIEMNDLTEEEADALSNADLRVKPENDLELNRVDLAPNPSTGNFRVSMEFAERGDVQLFVMDASGRRIVEMQLDDVSGLLSQEIDISEEENGVYFLIVQQNGKQYNQKIIKQ